MPQELFEQMCLAARLYSHQPASPEDQKEIGDENLQNA